MFSLKYFLIGFVISFTLMQLTFGDKNKKGD